MTKAQRDTLEAAGFALAAFGAVWWIGLPWLLVALGVLCIAVGNMGGTNGNPS